MREIDTCQYRDQFEQYAKEKNIDLRNELVSAHLYIAQIITKRFLGRGVEYDDLYQVASLALIKALERFEPERGLKFSTYATPTLVGEVRNYLRDHGRGVRIPRRNYEGMKKVNEMRSTLSQELGRVPRPDEIAQRLNMDTAHVLEILETSENPISLDAPVLEGEKSNTDLTFQLGGEDKAYEKVEYLDFLQRVIKDLPAIDRQIIQKRYFEEKSQRVVGKEMHVSQMYVSRVERKTLEKFRNVLRS